MNIPFYTKATLASTTFALIGKTAFGPMGGVAGFALSASFYAATKCEREWFKPITKSDLETLVNTAALTLLLIGVSNLLIPKGMPGAKTLVDAAVMHKERGLQHLLYLKLALAGPILEEIFFRGFLMDTLSPLLQKTSRIALQAILFGITHYSSANGASNPIIIAQCTLLGLGFGYLMEKTSNIALPLLFHGLVNFRWCFMQMR